MVSSLGSSVRLDTRVVGFDDITNQFICFFFTNGEIDFFSHEFHPYKLADTLVKVSFRCIVRYHAWLSCADFDDLSYGCQGFFIRFLTVNHLTVGTVDMSLDGSFALDSRELGDLTSITNASSVSSSRMVKLTFLHAFHPCKSVDTLVRRQYHNALQRADFDLNTLQEPVFPR